MLRGFAQSTGVAQPRRVRHLWMPVSALLLGLLVTGPVLFASIALLVGALTGSAPPWDESAPVAIGALAVALLGSSSLIVWLLRRYRRLVPRPTSTRGVWERFAERHPEAFRTPFALNGIGTRRLDFHSPSPDGTVLSTVWLTAVLPIAPIRRERVRVLGDPKPAGIPLLLWWTRNEVLVVEHLAVDRSRNLRVWAIYYLFLLPAIVGPVLGGLALTIAARPSALPFWLGAALVLGWGILMAALEERWMTRPAKHGVTH